MNSESVYIEIPESIEVPDKFRHPERGLNLSAMLKSYADAEAGLRQAEDRVRQQIAQEQAEAIPAEYAINAPEVEGVGDDFGAKLKSDPALALLKRAAAEAKMTQPQFDALVKNVAVSSIEAERKAEKALREALGANHDERWQAVTGKLKAKLPGRYEQLAPALKNPEVFQSIEAIINQAPAASGDGQGNGAGQPRLTKEALKEMTDDPRYWHPTKKDLGYIRKVGKAFEDFYAGQKYDASGATG